MSSPMPSTVHVTKLNDGTPVAIRPAEPADREMFEIGMDHLSDRSRYFRFLTATRTLTPSMLDYLTTSSGEDHVILGALDVSDGANIPAGVARYVRLPSRPETAEFAVTVVDRYQGRGLGGLLVGALAAHAAKHGLTRFVGLVHAQNSPMLRLCIEMGGTITSRHGTEVEFDIPVHVDPAGYPRSPMGDLVRKSYAVFSE